MRREEQVAQVGGHRRRPPDRGRRARRAARSGSLVDVGAGILAAHHVLGGRPVEPEARGDQRAREPGRPARPAPRARVAQPASPDREGQHRRGRRRSRAGGRSDTRPRWPAPASPCTTGRRSGGRPRTPAPRAEATRGARVENGGPKEQRARHVGDEGDFEQGQQVHCAAAARGILSRGAEAQRRRGSEAQRLRGSEVQRRRGSEARGSEVQRFRGSEVDSADCDRVWHFGRFVLCASAPCASAPLRLCASAPAPAPLRLCASAPVLRFARCHASACGCWWPRSCFPASWWPSKRCCAGKAALKPLPASSNCSCPTTVSGIASVLGPRRRSRRPSSRPTSRSTRPACAMSRSGPRRRASAASSCSATRSCWRFKCRSVTPSPRCSSGRLNARADRDVHYRVINAGVQGYGPVEELLFFREVASAFQPDLVLVAAFVANDAVEAYDAAWRLAPQRSRTVEVRDQTERTLRRLVRPQIVLQVARQRVRQFAERLGRAPTPERPVSSYLESPPPYIASGARRGEVGAAHARRRGARAQRRPDRHRADAGALSARPRRVRTAARGGRADGRPPPRSTARRSGSRRRLADLQLPVIDMLPRFRESPRGQFFETTVHLTPRGHETVAAALDTFIAERGLL